MPGSCYAMPENVWRQKMIVQTQYMDENFERNKDIFGDNYGATQENNAYKVDDLGGYCMFA